MTEYEVIRDGGAGLIDLSAARGRIRVSGSEARGVPSVGRLSMRISCPLPPRDRELGKASLSCMSGLTMRGPFCHSDLRGAHLSPETQWA